MTPLSRPRQRAEHFAALVDGTARPLGDDQRLLELVGALRAEPGRQPDGLPGEAFTAELRTRLMAEAATVLTPQVASQAATLRLPQRSATRRERRLVAAATAAILLGGTAGIANAASSSLPGEALYPLKRGIEQVEAGMSASSAGRGHDLLDQAGHRLDEVSGLLDSGSRIDRTRLDPTLRSFGAQASEGADLMMQYYDDTDDPRAIAAVREFAADDLARLGRLAESAPPEAEPALRAAAETLREIDEQASGLCATCSDLPELSLPGLLLAGSEVDQALDRVDGIQLSRLDNDHPVPVDKSALRRAEREEAALRRQELAAKKAAASRSSASAAPSVAPAPRTDNAVPDTDDALPEVSVGPKGRVRVQAPRDRSAKDEGTLGDGLGDAVRTLLPDVDTGDLLP